MSNIIKSGHEIKEMGQTERDKFWENLRKQSANYACKPHTGLLYRTLPTIMVNGQLFELDVDFDGLQRAIEFCLTNHKSGIFAVNHSNSHDGPNMHSILSKEMGLTASLLVASDPLSPFLRLIFDGVNSTLINRNSSESIDDGIMELLYRLLNNQFIVIFPESTWNLHPTRPMQGVQRGTAFLGAASEQPVIPTIMEYIEIPALFTKEKYIYKKAVIKFGAPMIIDPDEDIDIQSLELEKRMARMRREIWINEGIERTNLSKMNPIINANHTRLKIAAFDAANIEKEREGILFHGDDHTNAYTMAMADSVSDMWIPGTPGKEFANPEYLAQLLAQCHGDSEKEHLIVPLHHK